MTQNNLKYSQNFLKSQILVKELIEKTNINSQDIVYEIGPGKGIITDQLIKICKNVVGIEKDQKLYNDLVQRFKDNQKIEVKYGDFLKYDLPKDKEYKIFSNIPFDITADIVKKIISTDNPPKESYLIIQKEAAKKFIGFPYSNRTQMEALLLGPWFKIEVIHEFKRIDFEPIPQVDSVLIHIKKRDDPLIDQKQLYKDFVVYAFSQWKGNLRFSLNRIFTHEQFKRLTKDLGFDINAKTTELNFNQWIGLFNYFLRGAADFKKALILGVEKRFKNQQSKLIKIHRTR